MMKPNEPLTREALLQIADEGLRRHVDAQIPLDRVIQTIMESIPPHDRPPESNVAASPVPLGDVAAYVDGTLTDEAAEHAITFSARDDAGLLMEIVLAMKSQTDQSPASLPRDLRDRLVNLQDQLRQVPDAPAAIDAVLPLSHTEAAESSESEESLVEVGGIEVHQREERSTGERSVSWQAKAVVLAAAASILALVTWWAVSGNDGDTQIADQKVDVGPLPPEPPGDDEPEPSVPETREPRLVEQPVEVPERAPGRELPIDEPPDPLVFEPDAPMIVEKSPPETEPEPETVPTPAPPSMRPISPPARQLVATWKEIDGLLLRREASPQVLQQSQSQDVASSSVRDGDEMTMVSTSIGSRLRLQTLPLCRATADLSTGGQMVLAGDTQIDMTFGGAIDLRYGSIALMEVADNAVFRIGSTLAHSVPIRPRGGSVVVHRTHDGMEIEATESVSIGGETFENAKIKVDGASLAATQVDDAPERLPRWTRERVDRIELGRNVLAQLSMSDDVSATIRTTLKGGGLRGDAAATLREWFVASNRDRLLRLFGSDDPLIRETALNYMRSVGPGDPRHIELWRRMRIASQNQRMFMMVRTFLTDYWAGRRPPAQRRDQLLRMLAAPEPATRATADFLLRSFYGKGPPFILKPTPTAQTRMVNAWRVVMARSD